MDAAVKILLILQLFFGVGKYNALIALTKRLNCKLKFISTLVNSLALEITGHVKDGPFSFFFFFSSVKLYFSALAKRRQITPHNLFYKAKTD